MKFLHKHMKGLVLSSFFYLATLKYPVTLEPEMLSTLYNNLM